MSYNTILATTPLTSTGYHLKATGTTIGNSLIWDNGTNVGIGNTNTSYTLDVSGTLGISGLFTSTAFGSNSFSAGGTGYNKLTIRNTTAGAANGAQLSIGTNADPDQFYVQSFATTFTTSGMNIAGGAVINGEGPGGLSIAATQSNIGFYTNGAGSANERMRITSGGEVLMNTSSTLTSGWLCIAVPSNNYNAIVLKDTGTSYSTGNYYQLFTNSSNTIAGSISHNTATTIGFNTSSDYRLKEDFKDFNGLEILSKIKFYDFKWKEENKRMHGVIAHELQPLLPLAVSGIKDAMDEEGNIVAQGVDYSKIVPILGKAIQELSSEVQELKALIAAK